MPKCHKTDCRRRGQELPEADFHNKKASRTGLSYWCKECRNKMYRKERTYTKRQPIDGFLQVATEWNKQHPVIRSNDYDTRVSILKGEAARTVSI